MKKRVALTGLVASLLTLNTYALDLTGLQKVADATGKATAKVDQAQAKVEQTTSKIGETTTAAQPSAVTADQTALALVKAKVGADATQATVLKKLGKPITTSGKKESQHWFYDVSTVNKKLAENAALASALGVNVPGANKKIELVFSGDKLQSTKIAD
jgi:preprotein translocase subunit SecF